MDLRKTFNENVLNYANARPGYMQELFADIFDYAQINPNGKALEIGIGTGQATKPFLDRGYFVTAVELGDQLAAYAKTKFASYSNFHILHADFMETELEAESFDILYSATAFHWLPQQAAYQKVFHLLKPGGTIALFWNHPFPNRPEDESNQASQRVYDKYRPSEKAIEFSAADCKKREQALREAGFTDVKSKIYHRVRTLHTEEYIALLNTYSDHLALKDDIRHAFEEEMRQALRTVGGTINIYDTVDLYLARKQVKTFP